MSRVAAWRIPGGGVGGPVRLTSTSIDLERHLEDWIVEDPSLLDDGLMIVARQMHLSGGPLDLLCIDRTGGLVVVELKRGRLYRDAVAQALDYSSSLSTMPGDELSKRLSEYLDAHPNADAVDRLESQASLEIAEGERRDVSILIAGTGLDAGFARVSEFLAEGWGVPIQVVTFQVLDLADGDFALVREAQQAGEPRPPRDSVPFSWDDVLQNAETLGAGPVVAAMRDVGRRHDLAERPWRTTFTLCPPQNRTRTLFAVWPDEDFPGHIGVDIAPSTLAEYFPVTEAEVTEAFGNNTRLSLDEAGVADLVRKIDALFAGMDAAEKRTTDGP